MALILDGTLGLTVPAASIGNLTLSNSSISGLTATGISAVQQLPTGSVLQVVNATYATPVTTTSGTLIDTGLTATITPTKSTSKILVLVNQNGSDKSTDNASNSIYIGLLRGATVLFTNFSNYVNYTGSTLRMIGASASICYLDSPATTSSITYKTQFANTSAGGNVTIQSNNNVSSITLMEIA
jgi:hypothetical protein